MFKLEYYRLPPELDFDLLEPPDGLLIPEELGREEDLLPALLWERFLELALLVLLEGFLEDLDCALDLWRLD